MKSIIEEASSIIKAIEKGWTSAGKPTEFTVKVLEQPVYNFLGFNTKPAKISFFFDDRTITAVTEKQGRESKRADTRTTGRRESDQPQQRKQTDHFTTRSTQKAESNLSRGRDSESQNQPRQQQSRPLQQQARQPRPERSADVRNAQKNVASESSQQRKIENQERTQKERAPQVNWNPETTNMAKEWIQQFLSTIHKSNIQFTTNAQNHILKVDFSGSITGNSQKELMLFKNAAHLLMSSLRNATNSELKQLKVVFSTAQA